MNQIPHEGCKDEPCTCGFAYQNMTVPQIDKLTDALKAIRYQKALEDMKQGITHRKEK